MKEKKDRQKGQLWRIVSVIAAAALLLGLVAVGLVRHYLGKIQRYGAEDDYTMSEEQIRQMDSSRSWRMIFSSICRICSSDMV